MNAVFNSTSHQRFERGIPVMGIQYCNRDVEIKQNIDGCSGYKLQSNDGYIVTIYNLDGAHPLWGNNIQMSPKPMRIINQSADKIELRGYLVDAMGPFGWMQVDQSDYGITLYLQNKAIIKCVLHMFDRGVDIEYYN